MTTLHLLAIAGYFLCLYEYIAMRHRVICAESDARMALRFNVDISVAWGVGILSYGESLMATRLYWNRGTK